MSKGVASRRDEWAAYGAATWAVAFAGVNIYLQIVGIDSAQIERHWATFTAINLSVVVLKAFGAAAALATVQRWGRAISTRVVSVCMWGAAAMLLLYAGFGLLAVAIAGDLLGWTLAGGTFYMPILAYLGFFVVGGTLFAVAAGQYQHRTGAPLRWVVLGALGAPLLLGAVLLGTSAVF